MRSASPGPGRPRRLSAVPTQRPAAASGSARSGDVADADAEDSEDGVAAADGKGSGSGSRPGSGSGSGSGRRPPLKRRTRYTARAAVLLLVFCALVLALAYPLQQYVSQNSQIDKLKRQNSEKRAEVDRLRQELERWQDPDYIRIQARSRLHYVLPGETGLRLLGSGDAASGVPNPTDTRTGASAAWYAQLWGSVTSAATSPSAASPTAQGPAQSPAQNPAPSAAPSSQTPSPTQKPSSSPKR